MLVRAPAMPCKASSRLGGVREAAAALVSRLVAAGRRLPLAGVLAVASLLATGSVGMWAVLVLAARLSAAS